ncbi:hypothetical protein L1787_23205 [Acuticoccus sp. M5D2P5]|uniref:hypothetical protein n=1 Tax=Acuticoccus kalidii TaxID=2910977 RepID=UPI001F3BDCEA|nr:hypothetical protein [Acuticoccus kalidii]MCF3936306.1 hypothetical protein [Acuticoccus kalidii]
MRAILTSCIVALGLAGCQMGGGGQPIEGNWASDDGVFIATFQNGAFSSRLTGTGETVVADGRYGRGTGGIQLEWTSIALNERRSAECTFLAPQRLSCAPSVGQTFTMTKVV